MTQAVLAEQLDVPVNTVSRWETGATHPGCEGSGGHLLHCQGKWRYPANSSKGGPTCNTHKISELNCYTSGTCKISVSDASELEVEWPFISDLSDPALSRDPR